MNDLQDSPTGKTRRKLEKPAKPAAVLVQIAPDTRKSAAPRRFL
jgi:hypothetical protein